MNNYQRRLETVKKYTLDPEHARYTSASIRPVLKHCLKRLQELVDKEIALTDKEPYIVWKCKTLQNWKYLMSTDLHDGMYYEVTYNGDKQEWYLDAYKKFENRCIPMNDVY